MIEHEFKKFQKLGFGFDESYLCNSINWGSTCIDYIYYVMAAIANEANNYALSQSYIVAAICSSGSLYARVQNLRHLSTLCMLLSQFQLSFKALQAMYKLSFYPNGNHIEHAFLKECDETMKARKDCVRMKALKAKMKAKTCAYCGKESKDRNLRSCTGCMQTMYCNKSCQKRHWNKIHHRKCDRSWIINYKTLKKV